MFNAVEYINTPRWQKVSLGLKRIKRLLELLGNPQDSLKFVHVAGTNGKGSTCAFLESIFRAAGLKTGLFTSPYLMCFEDRIRVNNQNITSEALEQITLEVKSAAEEVEREMGEHPTEFELMTAVAFKHFALEKCDIVVCEVGLGGRLDSTNVINPEICAITHIGLDHQAILGDTIEEIAREKAGIIKPNVEVVVSPQREEAISVIKEVAESVHVDLFMSDTFSAPFGLKGEFQKENAGVATKVAELLGVSKEYIKSGIAKASWPGRFEVFDSERLPCKVIVDGAHNVDGAIALRKSLCSFKVDPSTRAKALAQDDAGANVIAVFGALRDKDVAGMVAEVGTFVNQFVVYEVKNPRAMRVADLKKLTERFAPTSEAVSAESALDCALELAKEKDHQSLIVCFGSLYSVGDLRRHLINNLT